MAVNANLFGEGPPVHFQKCETNAKHTLANEYVRNEFSTLCNKDEKLNLKVLKLFAIGEACLKSQSV